MIMTRDDTKGSNLRTHSTSVTSIKEFELYLEENEESVKSINRKGMIQFAL